MLIPCNLDVGAGWNATEISISEGFLVLVKCELKASTQTQFARLDLGKRVFIDQLGGHQIDPAKAEELVFLIGMKAHSHV